LNFLRNLQEHKTDLNEYLIRHEKLYQYQANARSKATNDHSDHTLKNKLSLASNSPHEAAQDIRETSRTFLFRKLSFVAGLFRKRRQTILTFNGTALSHKKLMKNLTNITVNRC